MIKTVEERRTRLHLQEILNVGIEKVSEIVKEQIDVFGTQKLS
jgi:predicted oxidoreductase (fatty acid repression mutant protein)